MAKLIHCQLNYKFDKTSYLPGEVVIMNVWIKNMGVTYLYLSDIVLNFDFGIYKFPKSVYRPIAPKKTEYLGVWRFQLPRLVGNRKCIMEYVIHEYVNHVWEPHYRWKKNQSMLFIYPRPVYRLFLSRGIRPEDLKIGDRIATIIRQWGFYTVTVGIEVKVPDDQVAFEVRRQILMSDALLVIATPRTQDVITQTWKSLEWIHAETGIAYGFNKPLHILKDNCVSIGGLPSYLTISDDNREKVQAMELFKDKHLVKLELLSNATTIDSALHYIRNKQQDHHKRLALDSTSDDDNYSKDQLTAGRQTVF
jgi:hypothetical protein